MNDDDRLSERRTVPTTAVLEWRVTQLEHQAQRMNDLMVENKNEILTVIRDHNSAINSRFDEAMRSRGKVLDRCITGVTACAAIAAAFFAVHK